MSQGIVIAFLMGPPGSGKTRLARLTSRILSASLHAPVLHVEVDDIRHMIVSEGPSAGDEDDSLWPQIILSIIQRCQAPCAAAIVEGLFYSANVVNAFHRAFGGDIPYYLDVPLHECLRRNRGREPFEERLPDAEVERLHQIARPYPYYRLDGMADFEHLSSILAGKIRSHEKRIISADSAF